MSALASVIFRPHLLFFSMLSPVLSFINGSFISSLFNVFTFNLTVLKTPSLSFFKSSNYNVSLDNKADARSFSSKDAEAPNYYDQFLFIENTSSQRATRFSNALINYDYKTGHYLGG